MWTNGVRVRGWALPDGEPIDLFADGDRWTTDPVPGVEVSAEGWILPGLVDVHTHPGAANLGDTFDHDMLRDDLRRHLDAGVTLIRAPGLGGEPPAWFGRDEELPRSVHAGQWFAQAGQFVDGWARRPDLADLPAAAAEQAARTGWAKIIGDWLPAEPSLPIWEPVLRETVAAVHAAGGRVAMHAQLPESAAAAVAAGVDSIEHGMSMDHALLDDMARTGIALTPTLSVIAGSLRHMKPDKRKPRRQWYIAAAKAHPALAAAAYEAGVVVLAGTDSHPTGRIVDEIRALVAAGMPAVAAIGAASWQARSFLGFGGLADGDRADAVVYDADPRTDLGQLESPRAIILRGRLVLRR